MDAVDRQILTLLQDNARIANAEIARRVGMVPSGVLERIRKLEESGVIREYTARLRPESVELGLVAFVFVKTDEQPGQCGTARSLSEFQEVLEVHHVAGEDCYLVKIRLADNRALARFLRERIGRIPTIVSTRSVIVLETIKETAKVSLPSNERDHDRDAENIQPKKRRPA